MVVYDLGQHPGGGRQSLDLMRVHRMVRILNPIVTMLLFMHSVEACPAQEWTRFRGPNGSGISDATTIPVTWTDETLNWKVELPGAGHGSPVARGQKLFINCASEDGTQRMLQCRDTHTGDLLWSQSFAAEAHKTHKLNSFATSTPAVDADYVYIAWGTPDELVLKALDHRGNEVWTSSGLGGVKGGHGFGASPIVYRDLVVLNNDQDGDSSLVAVDRRSGELRWQVPRRSQRLSYSTPVVRQRADGRDELVFSNWTHGITAIDPDNGNVNWEIDCFPHDTSERTIGSPVLAGDLVIATCAFVNSPKHLVAVHPLTGGAGDRDGLDSVTEAWRVDDSTVPHIPTMIAYDSRLYAWSDQGILTCYETATGRKVYQKRIGGKFFSSPVCVNGTLYAIGSDGEVIVAATGDEFVELGRSSLGESCQSTPAVANGTMFIRTTGHLVSVGGQETP